MADYTAERRLARKTGWRLVRYVESALGPIDILVNNAGMAVTRGIDDLTEEDFDFTIATNLKPAFLCMRAAVPGMRSRSWGGIINISSGAARGEEHRARIPVGRLGTGEEVAAAVVMVAGNAYMTGQTAQVNGGLHFN